jgi:chaperonin GroEL
MRAAVQEGAVPGGGLALLKCKNVLEARYRRAGSVDERAAYGCLLEAVEAPARVIYQNAGYEPGEVLAQLNGKSNLSGFDVVRGRVVNMMDAGILDSLMVLKSAVRNAVSTAALALTIDSLVHVAAPEMVGKPT